jgi:flagellar assembly protein FliH
MSLARSKIASWSPPAVEGPLVARGPNADELPAPDRQAWERGFAAGQQAGVIAIRDEHAALTATLSNQVQQLAQVLEYLAQPLSALDADVELQLMNLACGIAKGVIRRELKLQPDAIIALVRDTVKLLPIATREIRVHLHPEDAAIVRERLSAAAGERAWTVLEDPMLSRGGCLVRGDDSTVDVRIEQRVGEAIAAALGDERGDAGRSQ